MLSIASKNCCGKLMLCHFRCFRQMKIQTMIIIWRVQNKRQSTSKWKKLPTHSIGCSVSMVRSNSRFNVPLCSQTSKVESMESGETWQPRTHTSINILESIKEPEKYLKKESLKRHFWFSIQENISELSDFKSRVSGQIPTKFLSLTDLQTRQTETTSLTSPSIK